MGITGLIKFLHTNTSTVEEIAIGEYENKIVAIDISIYMHRFKYGSQHRWIYSFIRFLSYIRSNFIHCIAIFDSKAPTEKKETKDMRKQQQLARKKRLHDVKRDLELYLHGQEPTSLLLQIASSNDDLVPVDEGRAYSWIHDQERNIITFTNEDYANIKRILQLLDIPYMLAYTEAEKFCATLFKKGYVAGVVSEDSDVLVYGADLITKIDQTTCRCIRIRNVLQELEITQEQFVDMAIMCGTDYNKRGMFRVGPKKAYDLIKKYGKLENIEHTEDLNYERLREIFLEDESVNRDIPYCTQGNLQELSHMYNISLATLKEWFPERDIILN